MSSLRFDLMGYQRAYEGWRDAARVVGRSESSPGTKFLKNLRTLDVIAQLNLLTTDVGIAVVKPFFSPPQVDLANPLLNTKAPNFAGNGQVPTSSFYGLFAMGIQVDDETPTLAQWNTLRPVWGGSRLELNIGANPATYWQTCRMLYGFPGRVIGNDHSGAAPAAAVVSKGFVTNVEMTPLPAVKFLNPGASVSANFIYSAAVMPLVQNVLLHMHLFVGDQGED